MSELVIVIVGLTVLFAVGYAGFLGGRDAAERKAYSTIAILRGRLASAHLEVERLTERNRILAARIDRARLPKQEVPEWLN